MTKLKQKLLNLTTYMLNAYSSTQPSSLSAIMTHNAKKCHESQLSEACGSVSAMKLMLTTVWGSTTLSIFTASNLPLPKKLLGTAVRCVEEHFLILYACTHVVSFHHSHWCTYVHWSLVPRLKTMVIGQIMRQNEYIVHYTFLLSIGEPIVARQ